MSHILPDGWRALAVTGAAQREIETLARLADSLSDDYTVYHAVHWSTLQHSQAVFGEIDFVVVNRAGDLLLIEQKSGFLDETPDGLVKRYPGRTRPVAVGMARAADALRARLTARADCGTPRIEGLLYCPDYRVRDPLTAGLDPAHIVDQPRRELLGAAIAAILPPGEPSPGARNVHRFLRDEIRLEADVSALIGRAHTMVTRLAEGLALWARRIQVQPYRLRVTGTAGSGKTQLALAEYRAAIEAGKRPLYLCFNRPLADHFKRIAPAGGLAASFHEFCDLRLREAGQVPDFSTPGAFTRLVDEAAALPVGEALFDTVIVDEGQDFSAPWRDMVLRHARPDARLLWLEDPLQNLYQRPPVELPGWVGLTAPDNFRNPRPVVRLLRELLPQLSGVEARSPFDTDEVDILTYTDHEGLVRAVKDAVRGCYAAGFRHDDVAVLSFHGREQSALFAYDRLGPHALRRFTGNYDLFGQPVYSSGEVLLESVYRFKGQAAPAVVLAEIDFTELDERAARKLFVGATRAGLRLTLVMAEPAARLLAGRRQGAAG